MHERIEHDQTSIGGYRPVKTKKERGVYVLKHPNTGNVYVGSTVDIYQRRTAHLSALSHNQHTNRGLQESFNIHPKLNLEFIPASPGTSIDELRQLEKEVIEEYAPYSKLFNIALDPTVPIGSGQSPSKETRKKLAEAMTGRYVSSETRQKRSETMSGVKHTDVRRDNISMARTKYAVMVDDVVYKNAVEAAKNLNISSKAVVRKRCLSDNFPNYRRIETSLMIESGAFAP